MDVSTPEHPGPFRCRLSSRRLPTGATGVVARPPPAQAASRDAVPASVAVAACRELKRQIHFIATSITLVLLRRPGPGSHAHPASRSQSLGSVLLVVKMQRRRLWPEGHGRAIRGPSEGPRLRLDQSRARASHWHAAGRARPRPPGPSEPPSRPASLRAGSEQPSPHCTTPLAALETHGPTARRVLPTQPGGAARPSLRLACHPPGAGAGAGRACRPWPWPSGSTATVDCPTQAGRQHKQQLGPGPARWSESRPTLR